MAPSVADAVRYVVAEIEALGVRAAGDPTALADLPGVLVYPNMMVWDRLSGDTLDLTLDLLLVASGVNAIAALDQLDGMLGILRDPLGLGEVRAVSLNLPSLTNGGDPVPALQATISLQVTED